MHNVSAFLASIVHCIDNPASFGDSAVQFFDDGVLVVENGRVDSLGPSAELLPPLGPDVEIIDLRGKLIVPGFVDCHVHYPQIDIVASYGGQLLDWLERYAYPAEIEFENAEHARLVAERFTDQLLANGTTSALVFATVHAHSATALFEAAKSRGMRLITGKTLMDRNAPAGLLDSPETAETESRALIERWHGEDRLGYALTPRFALSSSAAQLSRTGSLAAEYPDVYIHSHLAENRDEIDRVAAEFPGRDGYLDVYRHYGLLRDRSIFAHCIHLDEDDRRTMADAGASIAFCPSSNLFLGSGLFDLEATEQAGVSVGLGTDVGAGPSLSPLRTLADAYRVGQLRGRPLDPYHALYIATLGAARALSLDGFIGNFTPGKEADFTVLDTDGDSPASARCQTSSDLRERLFALEMLGDERNLHSTWLLGRAAYR